jgi:hypothetical protein
MQRIEKRTDDLRRDARGGWKLETIRSGDIEEHDRNKPLLREEWMYGNWQFPSSSERLKQYCDVLWRNH